MATLCSNYLKKRNRLNDSVCQFLNEDDYGFLPWSQQIFTKAKRQLGTQTNGLQSQEDQKNITKESKLKTSALESILDNQEYLSPVNIIQGIQTENGRSSSVSPLYHCIDSPTLVKARMPVEKTQSTARRCLFDDILSNPNKMNAERQENMLNNNDTISTLPPGIDSTQSGQKNNYYENKQNYLVNFNRVECVDETADHCMSLSDVEDKLHSASVFLPANILMQTTVTHFPKTPNNGELGITKGVIVTGMFKTRNWVCVKLPTGISGYVPYECVRPLGVKMSKDFTQQFPEGKALKDDISTKLNNPNSLEKSLYTPIIPPMLAQHECNSLEHVQSEHSSQEGIYVLADNLYEHVYGNGNNYDEIDSDKDSITEVKDRCLLTETIEKCRHSIVQKDLNIQRKRTPLYLNNNLPLTPALSKLQFSSKDTSHNLNVTTTPSVMSPSTSPRTESNSSDTTDLSASSCERDYISLTAKCYICKKSVKSKNSATRKFTCAKCVLAELKHTPDYSKDCGYESSRSEHGYNSNVNTQINDSKSNLLRSIESLNISEDSGQETYSQDSYNLETSSEYSDSENQGANLTVLFDYDQKDSHDLSIKKQEIVTLLYDRHESWLWVRNGDGIEGYVPKNYVVNLERLNLDPSTKTTYL